MFYTLGTMNRAIWNSNQNKALLQILDEPNTAVFVFLERSITLTTSHSTAVSVKRPFKVSQAQNIYYLLIDKNAADSKKNRTRMNEHAYEHGDARQGAPSFQIRKCPKQ